MTPRPPLTELRQADTCRLIPSHHAPRGESVLADLADDDAHLRDIFEIESATNDRLIAERRRAPGIGMEELVFGVPNAHVINAAFCHAHPLGARFSGSDRGAWYAGFELETAQAEVTFHRSVQLAEIGRADDTATYDLYLADFSGAFHDLRAGRGFRPVLAADSYLESQALAARLLEAGSLGVVYPSVRASAGTCLACFRPAVVANVRRTATYRVTWKKGLEGVRWVRQGSRGPVRG
jgi:hypothetical protein